MDERLEHLKAQMTAKAASLEDSKKLRPIVHGTKRFFEIEGLDLSGLLALELFTVIIPLVLLGYSWAADFNANLSFGDFLIKWMDLKGSSAEEVQNLFGTTADLRSTWTFIGLMGFLIWGIPMSAQVAKIYAEAFRRERWPFWKEAWRGSLWFVMLLATQILSVVIRRSTMDFDSMHILFIVLSAIPSFVLWSLSPLILIRNGTNGWKHMAWCGLVGVVLDSFGSRIVLRLIFPKLLNGWVSFGPIGAAMAIMTTTVIIATLWVVSAVLGAVMWERTAPVELVIESQDAVPTDPAATRNHAV